LARLDEKKGAPAKSEDQRRNWQHNSDQRGVETIQQRGDIAEVFVLGGVRKKKGRNDPQPDERNVKKTTKISNCKRETKEHENKIKQQTVRYCGS